MTSYKVTYFDVRALGEPIRMLLSYMGKEFEDSRVTFDEWQKIKPGTPFGKLPMLEIDGKAYTQSAAICRYLGREAGLAGSNSAEDIEIDIIVDTFQDFRLQISAYHHEQDAKVKEEKRQKILKEVVPFYFGKFEEILKKNGYLANAKLSWGDIYVAAFSESLESILKEEITANFPSIQAWRNKVFNVPQIKAWIAKRPETAI